MWPWWKTGVIYHIYVRSFADSNGDGIGDLPGLIGKLDYLGKDGLGVDAIWLSPIFCSPDKDFGYDAADYCAIDPRYGTLADFDRLIREAQRRGIRVLLDLAFNHTSSQHPWFLDSRSGVDAPKRDWYVWHSARNGGPPNNWQSVFGGRAWTWDPATGQFYHHLFLPEQPDLNWRNPLVRRALMDVVRFWLDRGVYGFRLDVFNTWYEHPEYRDNPRRLGLRAFDRQVHIHDIDQPEMFESLAELRALLDSYPERMAVGEPFGEDPYHAARYCGDDRLHMVFNFEFTKSPWKAGALLKRALRWEDALGGSGWPCYVLANHDLPRLVSRLGRGDPDSHAKLGAALLLTLRGTPFIYYGEEIGMADIRLRRDQILDPPGQRYWPFYKGRDGCRSPMQWDDSTHAGFTTGKPWLPVHPDYANRYVAAHLEDPNSILSFYRALIRLRRRSAALRRGDFLPLQTDATDCLVFLRRTTDEQVAVMLNLTPRNVRMRLNGLPSAFAWHRVLSSEQDSEVSLDRDLVSLKPHEAAIFRSA
jgi:alpha-glucosidase